MSNLPINYGKNSTEFAWDTFYYILSSKKYISFYSNGRKYFLFTFRDKILCFSEWKISLILCSLTFLGIVSIRKSIKKFRLKKKVKNLMSRIKIRGGSDLPLNLIDETEILNYETQLRSPANYYLIASSFLKLTAQEKLIKSIIKKCLKPNRFYKITNRGLLEIVDKMMKFRKKDHQKIISYDSFILALVIGSKPSSSIAFEGTNALVQKIGSSFLLANSPIFSALLTAVVLALRFNLEGGLISTIISFISMLLKSSATFRSAELIRSLWFIDCSDYGTELPVKEVEELTNREILDENSFDNSKLTFSDSEPTRHDTFVSTAPGQELHYESKLKKPNFEVETVEGTYKEGRKLNGEKTLTWRPHRQTRKPLKSNYIPLTERTRTLSDVKDLDTTLNRDSASAIQSAIEEEQITFKLMEESIWQE